MVMMIKVGSLLLIIKVIVKTLKKKVAPQNKHQDLIRENKEMRAMKMAAALMK